MCIIVVKCKGTDFAPKEVIARCMKTNPHGFSMAWNRGGQIEVFRTMDPSEMMARYEQLTHELDPRESAMLFHARKATHGSCKVENTHCFTYGEPAVLAFCHNGILHNIKNRDDMTDSETFFRDLFIPAMEGCGETFAYKMAKAIVETTGNKFAFLNKDGKVTFVRGEGVEFSKQQFPGLRGKIYFSNDGWRPVNAFGLDFNPYEGVAKSSDASLVKCGGSQLPSVGVRHRAAPGQPLRRLQSVDETLSFLMAQFK